MSKDEIAANEPVVDQDTTPADSAPVENNKPDVEDDFDIDDVPLVPSQEPESKPEPVQDKPEEEAEEPKDKPDVKDSPEDEWNSLKGNSQERFRQAINERNELRRQMEEYQAKQAQFATEQDLLNEVNPDTGEYYTPQEAERASWLQARQAQAEQINRQMYETQVRQNQLAIDEEASKVQQEFALLNPQSKEFDQEIASQYAEMLNESLIYAMPDGQTYNRSTLLANGVNPDAQATLVNYTTSPYKLAKLVANSVAGARAKGETIGQANAQKATEKMLSNVDSPADVSTGSSSSNDLDSIFDRVKDVPLG